MKTFVGQKYLIFRVKGGSPKLFRNKLAIILFGPGGLFMSKMPMFQRVGRRVATSTSISIFDSYDMKSL